MLFAFSSCMCAATALWGHFHIAQQHDLLLLLLLLCTPQEGSNALQELKSYRVPPRITFNVLQVRDCACSSVHVGSSGFISRPVSSMRGRQAPSACTACGKGCECSGFAVEWCGMRWHCERPGCCSCLGLRLVCSTVCLIAVQCCHVLFSAFVCAAGGELFCTITFQCCIDRWCTAGCAAAGRCVSGRRGVELGPHAHPDHVQDGEAADRDQALRSAPQGG